MEIDIVAIMIIVKNAPSVILATHAKSGKSRVEGEIPKRVRRINTTLTVDATSTMIVVPYVDPKWF